MYDFSISESVVRDELHSDKVAGQILKGLVTIIKELLDGQTKGIFNDIMNVFKKRIQKISKDDDIN